MRRYLWLFLLVWGASTMTVNSWNARSFGLQNATVAGLAQHRTFALRDQVFPGFNLVEGDETLRHGSLVYPIKQPGQTIVGALVYAPLYSLHITFANHYDYVSNVITAATSGVFIACVSVLLAMLAESVWAGLLFFFATIVWPYAGVSHHDIYALLPLTLGIYAFSRERYARAGLFFGLMWFFSMLPLTLPIVAGLVILRIHRTSAVQYGIGFLVGLVPTILYNWILFGNPLLFPNLAGGVIDTIPKFSLANLLSHLYYYVAAPATSLIFFSPVLVFGFLGLFYLPKRLRTLSLAVIIFHILHISSQWTYGGYEYGPRYFLPLIPFFALGIGTWMKLRHRTVSTILFVVAAIYSSYVAMVGALTTVMYPLPYAPVDGPATYAPFVAWGEIVSRNLPTFRLWPVGVILVVAGLAVRYLRIRPSSWVPEPRNHGAYHPVASRNRRS